MPYNNASNTESMMDLPVSEILTAAGTAAAGFLTWLTTRRTAGQTDRKLSTEVLESYIERADARMAEFEKRWDDLKTENGNLRVDIAKRDAEINALRKELADLTQGQGDQ